MELRKTLDASVENQAVGQAAAEMFLEKIKKGTFHVPGPRPKRITSEFARPSSGHNR
jgi:hypothetical protein